MKLALRTLLVAFIAALIGVLAGRMFLDHRQIPKNDIHTFVHEELSLDSEQKARLADLERQFAVRRTALEMELRTDNALLAEAIEAEKTAGPRVNAAVDRCHEAMGRLQKETLAHIFAMRQLLRPDQAKRYDQAVVKALTEDSREP
ncbi:MAG: periplasmic heavy metal sensor [Proteobacteria bacterium]|nr:periplasmic heavy metal sensor [Pseudomonadota bacterium]